MARVSLAALAALAAAAAVAAAAAPPQRRRAGVGAGAGAARGAGLVEPVLPSAATAAARVGADGAPTLASIVSVADFGAVTGGGGDNTAAFQAALDSLAPTGGVVFVPAGNYSFSGALVIPTATALVGVYQSVPSHEIDQGATLPNDGSVLLPRANAGNDTATPFITVSENGAIKGFTIFYPDQAPDVAPVPYPWTIALTGNNPAVLDVELLNCACVGVGALCVWVGVYVSRGRIGAAPHPACSVERHPGGGLRAVQHCARAGAARQHRHLCGQHV